MMVPMATAVALSAGKTTIDLVGDGSYQHVIHLGSWAFCAPEFGLENSGIETGPGIEHFEITAVLAGIEAILRIDHTQRPDPGFHGFGCRHAAA
jgi:hypothetical protein